MPTKLDQCRRTRPGIRSMHHTHTHSIAYDAQCCPCHVAVAFASGQHPLDATPAQVVACVAMLGGLAEISCEVQALPVQTSVPRQPVIKTLLHDLPTQSPEQCRENAEPRWRNYQARSWPSIATPDATL